MSTSSTRRGALFGLGAAALFGLSAPLAKRLVGHVSPTILAGLLYLGAGLALTVYRGLRRPSSEPALRRMDVPFLVGVVVSGGIIGPVLMLFGLARTSALAASLLLNLEAPFTIAIALLVFGEHLGKRAWLAIALILAGAVAIDFDPLGSVEAEWLGGLLLAAACAAWAVDNNLTQKLSARDPVALVQIKTLSAGAFNLALGLAFARGELPGLVPILAALALGSVSYGVSVVFDAYALRLVGAAREAAYFATAPFMGALASIVLLGERLDARDASAMALMALGVTVLVRENRGVSAPSEGVRPLDRLERADQ